MHFGAKYSILSHQIVSHLSLMKPDTRIFTSRPRASHVAGWS